MISARELRIGNYLQGTPIDVPRLGLHIDGVTQITAYGIHMIEMGYEGRLEPIPLTEEWMLKLSHPDYHPVKSEIYGVIIVGRFNIYYHDINDKWYVFIDGLYPEIATIRYVHEWQNIFHALERKELTIKE